MMETRKCGIDSSKTPILWHTIFQGEELIIKIQGDQKMEKIDFYPISRKKKEAGGALNSVEARSCRSYGSALTLFLLLSFTKGA